MGFPGMRGQRRIMGMNAILDVPEIRAQVHRWTVADDRALAEDRLGYECSELIRGIIVEKEIKTPLHDYLTGSIATLLQSALRPGQSVRQEKSSLLTDSVPEPDVAVVCGALADFRDRHPTEAELVVEVAVTSLAADREKAALYAEAGVGEYWIVLAEAGLVEVYRRPVAGTYRERRTYGRGEIIEAVGATGGSVAVDALFG